MKLYSIHESMVDMETFTREDLHQTLIKADEFVTSQIECLVGNFPEGETLVDAPEHNDLEDSYESTHDGVRAWRYEVRHTDDNELVAVWVITEHEI